MKLASLGLGDRDALVSNLRLTSDKTKTKKKRKKASDNTSDLEKRLCVRPNSDSISVKYIDNIDFRACFPYSVFFFARRRFSENVRIDESKGDIAKVLIINRSCICKTFVDVIGDEQNVSELTYRLSFNQKNALRANSFAYLLNTTKNAVYCHFADRVQMSKHSMSVVLASLSTFERLNLRRFPAIAYSG